MAYKDKSKTIAYNNDFIAKAYDRIKLTVPKGRTDEIKSHAERHSESVNGFINRAIDETIERDKEKEGGE